MNPFGIFVCILWGTVALFSVLSFVTVVHNNRRNLKRAQAVVIGKNVSPSGRTSTARASDAKTDYIILFSIFCEMLQTLPFPAHWFSLAATGFLEVTNGVALLSTSACTRQIKSLLAVLFLSWGGLSGIFQVSSILHQTGLSLRNYVLQKIILLLLTVGCCIPLLFLGILI